MLRRSRNRRSMENSVSKIGTPNARTGRAKPTSAADFVAHITLAEPSRKPRNILPQSPIKIRAGLKLKNKNPDKLPVKASIITASTTLPPANASTAITVQAIAPIPAASPSSPSIRFTALVILIIQKIVNKPHKENERGSEQQGNDLRLYIVSRIASSIEYLSICFFAEACRID